MTVIGLDRKCRSEACGKWSSFKPGDRAVVCPWCATPYGKLELGNDVHRYSQPSAPRMKAQPKIIVVDPPKPGEFGA